MKQHLPHWCSRGPWAPAAAALAVWAVAVSPMLAQDPLFPPRDPSDPGVRTDDPDVRPKQFPPLEGKCLVPYPEPQVSSSTSLGCDGQPATELSWEDFEGSDCLVPYPEKLPIVPYLVPRECEDYQRPEEGVDYALYEPAQKGLPAPAESDWLWRLRLYGEWNNQADNKGNTLQELATFRFGGDVGADIPVHDRSELQFEVGTRYSRYDFEVTNPLPPFRDVYSDYANLRYFNQELDYLNFMALGSLRAGEETNANFSESLHGILGLGAQVELDDGLAVGAAVAGMNQLEGGLAVWPIPWVTWQISDEWLLHTDWNHQSGIALSYMPDQWESYHLKGFWDFDQFVLNDGGVVPSGSVQDERVGVSLGAEWRTSDLVTFWVDAGVYVWRDLELHTDGGGFLGNIESNPSPFVQFGVKVNF